MSAFLGIDWGTHSSKWIFQSGAGVPIVGEIWDSGVARIEDDLVWFPLERRFESERRESGLKRKLIQDPDQSFWEGPRPKLGVTLGEAVVFSVVALLCDADRVLRKRGKDILADDLTVRFSHPNWIDHDNISALAYFRDAAVLALILFTEGLRSSRSREIKLDANKLSTAVRQGRELLTTLVPFPTQYKQSDFDRAGKGRIGSVQWQLAFESCAAGFPYLLADDRDIFEEEVRKLPTRRRVRKILVVDVGAGSTDVGYLVRTVRPRNADPGGIMRPLLIWLPAASALEVAGRWLTDKVLADLKQQGRRVTPTEAEEFKIQHPRSWGVRAYLQEWSDLIAAHVADYAKSICDEVCLPEEPPLEVVLTGGSSVVSKMRNAVLEKVQVALPENGVPTILSNKTRITEVSSIDGVSRTAVEIAQLAVALGCSDPSFSEMKAYPNGLKHTRSTFVTAV